MAEIKARDPRTEAAPAATWIGIVGTTLIAGGLIAVICLVAFDLLHGFSNPYMGMLTYFVIPGFVWMGIVFKGVAVWLARRRGARRVSSLPCIDLNNPRHRRNVILTLTSVFLFFLLSAFGSYRGHQVTESVQFCGLLCHTVMKPQYTAYTNSPHAKVRCTECHIGPGATWYVRSKISGMSQAYATLANTYPRPIPTPVQNLRPAQETCELCHWPEKFFGAKELSRKHFLSDETNTPWSVRMLLKVGGGNPIRGPVGGIHWHMIVANRIEYVPADDSRQTIPWVRLTNREAGREVIYESKAGSRTSEPRSQPIRQLDCIDCHNRPTHIFRSPNEALDTSLWLERIDPSIPSIKLNAVEALVKGGETESEVKGLEFIAEKLSKEYADYADQSAIRKAVSETQHIFRNNFFPEMKTSWKVRPTNIGHLNWRGCYRCHDGRHASQTGEVISHDCDACHTLLAQGKEPKSVSLEGLKFEHPVGKIPPGKLCNDCHTGA